MEKLKIYFKTPYEEKGVIKATLDMCLRALTLVTWVYLVVVLSRLLMDAILHEFNPMMQVWWFAYCFIVFVGGTWLAYILLFVRSYYEAEE